MVKNSTEEGMLEPEWPGQTRGKNASREEGASCAKVPWQEASERKPLGWGRGDLFSPYKTYIYSFIHREQAVNFLSLLSSPGNFSQFLFNLFQ